MSDWAAIDRQLALEAKAGYKAFTDGLSKYENPNEPGSLNFDMWKSGWDEAEENEVNYRLKKHTGNGK